MPRMTGPDCAVMCNLITPPPPPEDQCEWHRMTRRTGLDCAFMCNLINTHIHTHKYRGSFLATYSLLPLAMSTCADVGSDVYALIKELAIRRVQHRSETYSNEFQHLAEGTEVARLRR